MQTPRVRFVMVGGFLGAGKTTTLSRLARHYLDRGQRIGLVTNDQADDLVDTSPESAGRGSRGGLFLLPF
jgi:G3E family GTPase